MHRVIIFCWLLAVALAAKDYHEYSVDPNEIPDEKLPFKIETDYATPQRCEDPETGTPYKIGAEWISHDRSKCIKMTCETRYFPLVKKIECSEFFQTANPQTECNVKKLWKFPNCCEQCKRRN